MTIAQYTEQAQVTDWPQRIMWVVIMIALIAGVLALLWLGWSRRARRHGGLPKLLRLGTVGDLAVAGRYLGSVVAGDWLDRITAQHLGSPSAATFSVASDGIFIERPSGLSFAIPVSAIRGVRTDRGIAGAVYGDDGVLIITWRWGDVDIDSGFRAADVLEHASLIQAIRPYVPTIGERS